eukprot:gnl/Hemi2/4282_TR1497_c0_g1_i1.p1 gnl/Hemi2/4282_TR1497_c0_g1~~gnl/Hemi2/4282_TR1497_c0_g1_i1.p1  ORF type:complete len:1126 (+),score=475.80 gnl/Hemi2/4282_TR1497_c0_g1_i1:154-3531(+)
MAEDCSVKVAVRVRPFNSREKERNAVLIIAMNGKTTTITNPEDGQVKPFTFDFSYWSHDQSQTFHGQLDVFNNLGVGVLDNAWEGYNVSLFAYGQTGSGKSYSMVGYGEEKGIIPLAMEQLFVRVDAKKSDPDISFFVEASMMEIYNEQCRDLLNPTSFKPGGLKVRENPKTGPYVEDLSLIPVNSYANIQKLMDDGTTARTVASTNMNATSSRAHTMFTIVFKQTKIVRETGKATDRVSKINLIDLAGSERQSGTGATGDRLKEGSAINKSLSALGNCIKALAELSKPQPKGGKKPFVPYRDSVLTWLLKESLGGNAKTVMIAALSPADINYDETLSTLRYADRAKSIQNKAVINEDPNQKMIRELKEEIEKLRAALLNGGSLEGLSLAGGGGPDMAKQLEENERMIQQINRSWEDKLREAERIATERHKVTDVGGANNLSEEEKATTPFLGNLHEDPMMNEALVYFLKPGVTLIGRKDASIPQDITLSGINILAEHAEIQNANGICTIVPKDKAKLFVNGRPVTDRHPLAHQDRIIIGNNHVFRFTHPVDVAREKAERAANPGMPPAEVYDWAFATKELHAAMFATPEDRAAQDRLVQLEKDKKALEDKIRDTSDPAQKRELQSQLQQLSVEITKLKQEDRDRISNRKIGSLLDENLLRVIPMINEANAISEGLKKNTKFDVRVVGKVDRKGKEEESELVVTVKKPDKSVTWGLGKFENRLYIMREQYMNYQEFGTYDVSQENDPFYDPPEEQLIGKATVLMNALLMNFSVQRPFAIISDEGLEKGELELAIVPCSKDGVERSEAEFDEMDDDFENAQRWLNQRMDFVVKVNGCRGLPSDLCNQVFVKYNIEQLASVETEKSTERSINARLNHSKQYAYTPVTESILAFLDKEGGPVEFLVFGHYDADSGGGGHLVKSEFKELKQERDELLAAQQDLQNRINQLSAAVEKEKKESDKRVAEAQAIVEQKQREFEKKEMLLKSAAQSGGGADVAAQFEAVKAQMEEEKQSAIAEAERQAKLQADRCQQLEEKLRAEVAKQKDVTTSKDSLEKRIADAEARAHEAELKLIEAQANQAVVVPAGSTAEAELQKQLLKLKKELLEKTKEVEDVKKAGGEKSGACLIL